MATVKNTALHAVSLPSGRVLAPGKTATGVTLSDVKTEIEAGLLGEVTTVNEPDTGGNEKFDYTAGIARLKELDSDFKGQPKKEELQELLAKAEAEAAENQNPETTATGDAPAQEEV